MLILGIIIAGFALFATNNRFYYRAHTDEPGKVEQIQTSTRNLNHPLLLLNSVQVGFALSGLEATPEAVVWVGRLTSALFMTLSVLSMALTAYLMAGRLAGVLCGVFLLLTPMVIELSHYFKEDAALLMGVSFAFLAIALYQRRQTPGRLLFLALGATLACSAKHIGVLVVPFCVYSILKNSEGASWKRLGFFVLFTLVLYSIINYQMLLNAGEFVVRFQREITEINKGGTNATESRSVLFAFGKYLNTLKGNASIPVLLFFGFGIYRWWREPRSKAPLGQVLLFIGLLFLVLSCSPKASGRYFLPIAGMVCLIAAVGAAWAFTQTGRAWRIAGFALPLGLALVMQGEKSYGVLNDFRHDARREMAEWMTQHLPADAVVLQDYYGGLSNTAGVGLNPVPQKLVAIDSYFTPSEVESALSQGVQYVVVRSRDVSESAARRRKVIRGQKIDDAIQNLDWLLKGRKVWTNESDDVHVENVRTGFSIYQIVPALAK